MKLSHFTLTSRRFLQAMINLINDPSRGARAFPAPHYIAQFFLTFDGWPEYLPHSLPSESSQRRDTTRHIVLPCQAELPEVYRFLPQLSRGPLPSVSRGLTILLLVLLLVNCASSPTPWRSGSLFFPRRRFVHYRRYRIVFNVFLPLARCHYRLPIRDSAFYAADLARCTLEMPRAYLRVYTCRHATLQMRFKPVSGATVEQLCLRGPPGPFVVALPRLNLYKWARASLLSFCPSHSLFPSLFLDLFPCARSRAATTAACLSTRRPRGFNQG